MENTVNFKRLGTMIDCSRNAVMNVPSLKNWINILADLGYTTLLLYTEDTYEVENQPYFGYLRGRYTREELKEIDDYAFLKGIEVIPCIQMLAHLGQIFRYRQYREINDCDDILLVGDEKTYRLIDDMFSSLSKCLRSKIVNVGMDEAYMIGRGKYLDKNGLQDKSGILLEHLKRVSEIAGKYGYQLTMWADIFITLAGGAYNINDVEVPDWVKEQIPENTSLIYWDYYSTDYSHYDSQIKRHNRIKENSWFAGGLWTWQGFAPHNDFSMRTADAALSACRDNGVQDVFFTMWGDNGGECTPFMLLPSLYYAACLAKGETDMECIKKGFAEKYGIAFDDFMLLDLPETPNQSDGIKDPDKYMLYNDCFMGVFDSTVRDGDAESYRACAEKLAAVKTDDRFGFLFDTMCALCEALSLKFDIGRKTRAAYQADREEVKKLLPVYDALAEKLEAFYRIYRKQWMTVNKPHGFDVQDIRLGGLIFRVKDCRDRLCDYAAGKTDRIAELEEELLNYYGSEPVSENWWGAAVSPNCI